MSAYTGSLRHPIHGKDIGGLPEIQVLFPGNSVNLIKSLIQDLVKLVVDGLFIPKKLLLVLYPFEI